MSRRWFIFLITSANFFLSQFYRASNAVIANDLLEDLALDTQGLGTISAAFFLRLCPDPDPHQHFSRPDWPKTADDGPLPSRYCRRPYLFICPFHWAWFGGPRPPGHGYGLQSHGYPEAHDRLVRPRHLCHPYRCHFLHRDRGKHGCCDAPGPVSQCHGMATGLYGNCGRESASGAGPVRGSQGHAPGQVVYFPSRTVPGRAQGILRPCPALEKERVLDHLSGKFSELWYLWRLSDPLGRALSHGGHGPKCHECGLPDPHHEPWIHFGRTCLGDFVGQAFKDAEMGCLRGSSGPCPHRAVDGRPSYGNRFFSPCVPVFLLRIRQSYWGY